MPRRNVHDDDWDDESGGDFEADDGYGDDEYAPDDDESETVPCPYCREEIHEDAVRCPSCGNYISAEDAPPGRKPWWLIVGVIVCLVIVYFWIFGRG